MDLEEKSQLIEEIDSVLWNNDYAFRNREDFNEYRLPWNELAESADSFYYMLLEVKRRLEE